jgi:uncharacterized repeat protein (TIGR01451 family)
VLGVRSAQLTPPSGAEWERGGCYSSWCERGWYSSPAVADLDGDGAMEVIAAAYTLFVLDGETGDELWHVDPPVANARVWPGVVVADIDADGDLEILTAHGYGYVRALDHAGGVVWMRRPATSELRGLSVDDLDGDGTLEIVVTAAVESRTNTWVYEHDGTLHAGWPQLSDESGYAWGVFNDNAALGDIDGDGTGEIVVPSDVHYICAYERNGVQIQANAMYGDKMWGKVGVHVDHAVDLRGYANCDNPPHPPLEPRPNFAHSPATIADLNGDAVPEIVVVGNNHDCRTRPYTDLYEMAYVFNADRSRWSGSGYDWTAIPVPDGSAAPLSEDYNVIENNQPNPVIADLDGDGEQEILYSSYDGRVHAFWLDKTGWSYSVYNAGEGFYRFASEPVVADLNSDGFAEVIFGSWVQKGTYQTGKLHVVDYQGDVVYEVDLPLPHGSPSWNGALAAPTLANIDADPNLEVVLNTAHSGVVVYELPGSEDARILWGTGRGNYGRTGSNRLLTTSRKRAQPPTPAASEAVTYTLTLRNVGPDVTAVHVTDALPAGVQYAGSLWASGGSWGESGGVITWTGTVSAFVPAQITYRVTVDAGVTDPTVIRNTAQVEDGLGYVYALQSTVVANGHSVYLPLVLKGSP